MRSSHSLDRVETAFDGTQLVADAGLLLPATLAAHLGLRGLVERFLDLGRAAGRANVGDKVFTLVMSALAGSNADTGYFDADYGTAGGSWAWTSCAPGASYVGLDSTHNRDRDPEDVRYNLHYHDAKYDGATREKAIACHEIGHSFGLLQNGSTSSCMHNTPGTATTLIQGEKDLLNAHY